MRTFVKLDAGKDLIPDVSSIIRFRHRLEKHGLAERLLAEVNALLTEKGLLLRQGTNVDATLINAPSSVPQIAYVLNRYPDSVNTLNLQEAIHTSG